MELKAKNIEKREGGIYFSKTASDISYPEEGNQNCFEIEQDSFWFIHRNNVIKETILNYSPDRVIFDVGGGNGFVSEALQGAGLETVLVEPGINGALNAKKRKIKNIICSTLEDAGFQESSMASVGLFDVVEHIEDDFKFMSDIFDLIEENGYLYMTVPAYKFLWSTHDIYAGHFRRYSLASAKELLIKCGFKIEYATCFFSILPFPIFFLRSIPYRLGLNNASKKHTIHKKEHSNNRGLITNIMRKIWSWDLNNIKNKKVIGFGGSCLIVAKK